MDLSRIGLKHWLLLPVCLGAAAAIMFLIVGPLLSRKGMLTPDELATDRGERQCAYRPCGQPAAGACEIEIQGDTSRFGDVKWIRYRVATFPLCEAHAACAREKKWPSHGGEIYSLGSAALLGLVLWAILVAILGRKS